MSKRQAEFQIHNQPMSEAESRAASRMNNQAPSKATPAQLAQRKIREAKSAAGRRRTPGLSPAPTGPSFSNAQPTPSFSNTQSTPSFFGANPATPAFGANGVNGVQQQTFTAPTSSTFNFTASTGTNPFAASQLSNPFSTQNSSNPFSQQASAGAQQSSVFSQPPGPQSSSNPFGAATTFNFGQSSGANSSFPPTQNASIFSKSTPASSSFTFGSNPSLSQTATFGAAAQTPADDNDVSMDNSEAQFKSPQKSSAPGQSAESKPAPPMFGDSSTFSFTPMNNDAAQDLKPKHSPNLGNSLLRPKRTAAEQQAPTPASNSFQPSQPVEQTSREQSTQPSAPVFNFFPQPTEPGKEASGKSIAPASAQPYNPFAALKSDEKEKMQESKAATPFSFRESSGSPAQHNNEEPSEQKSQGAAPFNPLRSLQSGDGVRAPSQPQEQTSVPTPSQSSQSNGSTPFNSFQPLRADDSQRTQSSAPLNNFQPLKSASAEASQSASPLKPFQSVKPPEAEKPAEGSSQSAGRAGGLFQALKPGAEGASKAAPPPLKSALKKVSHAPGKADEIPQQAKADLPPPQQSAFAPASTSTIKPQQVAKSPEPPFEANNTHFSSVSATVPEQSNASGAGKSRRASETSNLFVQSLGQASRATPNSAANLTSPQPQIGRHTLSPTKPTAAQQKAVGKVLTTTTPSASASEPFAVKVKSHGSSNVPQELGNDDFADFDKSYRLRSLNAKFKKRIAGLDPNKHDFEPIIRFYATQRAAIGHPMGGLYHRAKAGEKRKTEEADREEVTANPAKRTKLDTTAVSSGQQAYRPVLGFSAITSVSTTPQPAAEEPTPTEAERPVFNSNLPSNVSTAAQPTPITSNTSNVFKSMLSSANSHSFGPSLSQSASATSASKPPEQQTRPPAFSSFTPVNSKTSTFHVGTQSNGNTTASCPTNGAQKTSQLFQPKPAAAPALEPPKFASAGGTDFMAAFAAQAKKNAAKMEAENKAKRKAEDFDSDEDDEAEYERRVAEEDRAKRAKIEAIAKAASGFTPVLSSASSTNGASPAAEQDGESTRDASAEGSDQSQDGEASESEEAQHYGEGDEDLEEEDEGDEETDEDDDIQAAMAKSHAKPKNPFELSSDPKSLFSRVSRPDAPSEDKGSMPDGASQPTQANNSSLFSAPPGTGLFGSRPSTPNHDSPKPFGSSVFSNAGSSTPIGDNTWKPGSAIKFGAPTSAPALNITPATPLPKTNGDSTQSPFSTFSAAASSGSKPNADNNVSSPKAFTSVFGAPSFATQSAAGSNTGSPKPFSNLFGDASKKTTANQSSAAHVGFSFGGPNKLAGSPFLAPSNVSSAITSRATSPGLTDNDSAAESGPDDQANDPQSDFMASRPGEENEDILFEVRTKALESMSEKELTATGSKGEAGWKTRGLGPLRVLKNSGTGRARIVMRSEPGANVAVNSPLIHDNKYDINPSGKEGASLKMGVYMDGKLKNWVFKIKTMNVAHELVDCLKANEPRGKDGEKA